MMNLTRVRTLKEGVMGPGPVVYWMSRDQRTRDNWALLFAQDIALNFKRPLLVVFCIVPDFLGSLMRNFIFMIEGLKQVEADLTAKNIPFSLLRGQPEEQLPLFLTTNRAACLVTDFDPLRVKRQWKERVAAKIAVPFHEVDAHNIVPCWSASSKQEYGAYTIRRKITRALPDFLHEFPSLKKHPFPAKGNLYGADWGAAGRSLKANNSSPAITWLAPGEKAAQAALSSFIRKGLSSYPERRNDPVQSGQSGLSPYLHFGTLSAQRVTLAVGAADVPKATKEAFLEELVIRRELADNFCFYNDLYDSFAGFPDWAKKTLDAHRQDRREYLYTLEQFEGASTHDTLWNAAQMEMVKKGKMHGYLRMYWAKKILEWSASPEEAMDIAITLNDRYELDGRDPNGYAGIAWSIGGLHDRAWGERPVFGKIRYMSYGGCRSKFDVRAYENYVAELH